MRHRSTDMMLICLYVDDLLVTGSDLKEIERFKVSMKNEFDMTDLGELTYFLGLEFTKTKMGLLLHQKKYVSDVLKRFNMKDCNIAVTPVDYHLKTEDIDQEKDADSTLYKQIVGCLSYVCNSSQISHMMLVL